MNIQDGARTAAQQECNTLLEIQGVLGAVVASLDGFDIASAVTRNLNPSKIAAMASSISAIGAVVSQEAELGESKSITVNTYDGFVYITVVELDGQFYSLNVIANGSAILAQIIYHCNEISKRLKNR